MDTQRTMSATSALIIINHSNSALFVWSVYLFTDVHNTRDSTLGTVCEQERDTLSLDIEISIRGENVGSVHP